MTSPIPLRWLSKNELRAYLRIGRKKLQAFVARVRPHNHPVLGMVWDLREVDADIEAQARGPVPAEILAAGTPRAQRWAGLTREQILAQSGLRIGGKR